MENGPRDQCGIFGIYAPEMSNDIANVLLIALASLQHRGQEGCGMVLYDEDHFVSRKGIGLATNVFSHDSGDMHSLRGSAGICHCRYSTIDHFNPENVQPVLITTLLGKIAIAENGNLTAYSHLRQHLLENGIGLQKDGDIEVIAQLLSRNSRGGWTDRIRNFMEHAQAAYALTVLTEDALYACRDAFGFRPLFIGALQSGYMVSSETCVFDVLGARTVREVLPGEIVRIDSAGVTSFSGVPPAQPSFCLFEYIYLTRPDSHLEDQLVYRVRKRLGEQTAIEYPVDADVVVGVPDSSLPSAIGYAKQSKIPYVDGFIKNRYIYRTFIKPTQHQRQRGVNMKLNPLRENIKDKRVVLVDDSIVRGNTIKCLLEMLWGCGAKEVHVRIAAPPVRHPCYMGIDISPSDSLIAGKNRNVEEIRKIIGATSLHFLNYETLVKTIRPLANTSGGYCGACFTGKYPLEVPDVEDCAS